MKQDLAIDGQLQLIILLSFPQAADWWPEQITTLLAQAEATSLCRLIQYHRVALAVERNLPPEWQALLPEPVLATLQQQKQQHSQQLRRQFFLQNTLAKTLTTAGIGHRFFKGITLSQQLYQDIGWRYSKDIDLLVGKADVSRTELCLAQQGFVSEFADLPAAGLGTRLRQLLQKDCVYTHSSGAVLELHWRLSNEHCRFSRFMTDKFLQQTTNFSIEELVYLSWHAAKSHCHRIKWLVDVAAYALKLQQQQPDWQQQAEQLARDSGALPQLRLMLGLMQQCYPGLVEVTIQLRRAEQQQLHYILQSWQQADLPQRASFASVLRPLKLQPELSGLIRSIAVVTYWPNPEDIRWLNKLPRPVNYLYLPVFPLFKIFRYSFRKFIQISALVSGRKSNEHSSS